MNNIDAREKVCSENVEKMTFEDAIAKLENLVRTMESGQTKLEDIIKKFEEAKMLSAYCQKQLTNLKGKIEILTNPNSDSAQYEDFIHPSENHDVFLKKKDEIKVGQTGVDKQNLSGSDSPSITKQHDIPNHENKKNIRSDEDFSLF